MIIPFVCMDIWMFVGARLDLGYMQLVTPSVVAMAVSTLMSTCRIIFHVSFFMISDFKG